MHSKSDKVGELGLCCISCEYKYECDCKCGVLTMRKLKVKDCHDLISELDHKENLLKEKQEQMKTLKFECDTLQHDIETLEDGKIYRCDCGGYINYNTNIVLMSIPPRYEGKCTICSETFYTETKNIKK